jgi:hypothetical protein
MTFVKIVEQFQALPRYRRLQALQLACEDALAVWRRYRLDGVPLIYADSIVGLQHMVDDTLPARALADAAAWLAGEPSDPMIAHGYLEPITAMQDGDLDFPGAVELAYDAIYHLHRNVVGTGTVDDRVVLDQVIGSLGDVDLDAWANEWWMRVWDGWASTPEPAYEPSPLSEAAFEALAAGNLAAALEALDAETPRTLLVRAIVLSLAARHPEAIDAATRGWGQTSIATLEGPNSLTSHAAMGTVLHHADLRGWLAQHLHVLVPDAIAVSPDRTRYTVIRGNRRVTRDLAGDAVVADTTAATPYRCVRYIEGVLWLASDLVDAQGVWGTFLENEHEDGYSHDELVGARPIAALGPGAVVIRHPSRVILPAINYREVLGDMPVVDAAIAEECAVVVTHDGVRVSIWHRDPPSCARIIGPSGAAPRRIALGGHELLIGWSNGTCTVRTV